MIDLWSEAVRSIETQVKPAHRDRWLRPIECLRIEAGQILLRAPNRYCKEWFEDNFLPSILRDLEERSKQRFAVVFEIADAGGGDAAPPLTAVGDSAVPVRLLPTPEPVAPAPDLLPRFTFDRFVVGPTNQF